MIRFNQPRYILPLILLPFIYVLYYFFDLSDTEEKEQEVEVASINPTLPDPFLDEDDLKDKFDAYQEAYKNNRKSSAIQEINRREEDEAHHKPSIPEEPLHPYPSKQIVRKTAYSQPNRTKELDHYEAQMKLFRAQMQFVDSLIRVEEGDGMDGQEEERRSVNPREKASPEPEMIDCQWSFEKYENQRPKTGEVRQEIEVGKQKLEVGSKKSEVRSDKQQIVKAKSTLSGRFNTIEKQESKQLIRAVIDEEIKVTRSSRVRLRLLDDVKIGQHSLRKGQFLFGVVHAFKAQRVEIGITSILNNGKIHDVSLEIYDLDGMKGLYIPESRYRELTKEVGENITSGQQLPLETTSNQKMQLIAELAKDAFNTTARTVSKAIRKQKARLKYNTQVYLVMNSN